MDELDVAFLGIIVTGAIAVGSFIVTLVNGRADRRHARQLAQDERLFASRSAVYEELLIQSNRDMLRMSRIYPVIGPTPEPPPQMSDEEWPRLEARVAAFGSDDVRFALSAYVQKGREFMAEARMYQMMEAQGREVSPDAYVACQRIREEAGELLDSLATRVRDELTSPIS